MDCSKERRVSSKKCDCPFKLKAKPLNPPVEDWKVEVRCGVHNHKPSPSCIGLPIFGRFTKEEKSMLAEHTLLNVKAEKSLTALKKRFVGNLSTITQLYKQRRMFRTSRRGSRTEIQELMRLIDSEHYVCWSRRIENSDVIGDIMWAHPESINLLRIFPRILIMDSTYKTNKYKLPLLEIVGVTSTELTFSVCFAYLSNERYDNFRWVLQTLRDMMVVDIALPELFITDRDLGLMSAVEVVFPESYNLLCRYHISKNVSAKCKLMVKKDRQETVMDLWVRIVDSTDEAEFYQRFLEFEQSCVDLPQFVNYVNNTWLVPHRDRFVLAWINKRRYFGNTTTNRYVTLLTLFNC